MAIQIPKKIGKEKVVGQVYGKSLISQNYIMPQTGRIEEYGKFRGKHLSAFILPVTEDNMIVAIRQYRMGPDEIVLELPGGNIKPDEPPDMGARRELQEETGYLAGTMVSLSGCKKVCLDPASSDIYFYPFLALNCKYTDRRNLDVNEDIEIVLKSWLEWLDAVYKISSNSSYSMLTTLLALPHVQKLEAFR